MKPNPVTPASSQSQPIQGLQKPSCIVVSLQNIIKQIVLPIFIALLVLNVASTLILKGLIAWSIKETISVVLAAGFSVVVFRQGKSQQPPPQQIAQTSSTMKSLPAPTSSTAKTISVTPMTPTPIQRQPSAQQPPSSTHGSSTPDPIAQKLSFSATPDRPNPVTSSFSNCGTPTINTIPSPFTPTHASQTTPSTPTSAATAAGFVSMHQPNGALSPLIEVNSSTERGSSDRSVSNSPAPTTPAKPISAPPTLTPSPSTTIQPPTLSAFTPTASPIAAAQPTAKPVEITTAAVSAVASTIVADSKSCAASVTTSTATTAQKEKIDKDDSAADADSNDSDDDVVTHSPTGANDDDAGLIKRNFKTAKRTLKRTDKAIINFAPPGSSPTASPNEADKVAKAAFLPLAQSGVMTTLRIWILNQSQTKFTNYFEAAKKGGIVHQITPNEMTDLIKLAIDKNCEILKQLLSSCKPVFKATDDAYQEVLLLSFEELIQKYQGSKGANALDFIRLSTNLDTLCKLQDKFSNTLDDRIVAFLIKLFKEYSVAVKALAAHSNQKVDNSGKEMKFAAAESMLKSYLRVVVKDKDVCDRYFVEPLNDLIADEDESHADKNHPLVLNKGTATATEYESHKAKDADGFAYDFWALDTLQALKAYQKGTASAWNALKAYVINDTAAAFLALKQELEASVQPVAKK